MPPESETDAIWSKLRKIYLGKLSPDGGEIIRPPFWPVAADVSPLKPFAVLSQLRPTEESMSRLTSAATMTTGDVLDHATSEIASGSKLGIDATKKLPGEGFETPLAAAHQNGCRSEGEGRKTFWQVVGMELNRDCNRPKKTIQKRRGLLHSKKFKRWSVQI